MIGADIVLATCNATWSHPAFGLRCLRANLGSLRERSVIVEFDPRAAVADAVAAILAYRPRLVGLGVYIWNAARLTELAARLKAAAPEVVLVLGGPEISYEWEAQPISAHADYIIRNEGEFAFADLCATVLDGSRPPTRVIDGGRPDLARVIRPYDEYTERDLAARFTYVETTRGCPFGCEFCLSSLDRNVREWPLAETLADLDRLVRRGARRFKFVDRTFNLDPGRAAAVLGFFLDRCRPGLVAHFELVPDRLPESVRALLRRFPPGSLRLEVGIQTFDDTVNARVGRRQDGARAEESLRFLRDATCAHVHADLLAGLPGEGLEALGRSFDRLIPLRPAEIQIGLLKRLRGTAIGRRAEEWGMTFDPAPPYTVRATRALPADDLARIARLSRYWERLGNRGEFATARSLLWRDGGSPFLALLDLSDRLYARFSATHAIALDDVVGAVFEQLAARGVPRAEAAAALWQDYAQRGRRRHPPRALRPYLP